MTTYLAAVFLLSFICTIEAQTDYCQLPCDSETNTACLRKDVNCGPGSTCGGSFKQIQLTDENRQLIIDNHNNLRNKVATGGETIGNPGPQPSASNMNALRYNRDLEYVAQCLANSCQYGHDKCRRIAAYSYVGQNIALRQFKGMSTTIQDVITNVIADWYKEVKDVNAAWVSKFDNFGVTIGHYTQQVWANTKEVGCGISFYVDADGWDTYYMVCNYGPGGNYLGEPFYKQGSPASDCGGQPVNSRYSGLCGPDSI